MKPTPRTKRKLSGDEFWNLDDSENSADDLCVPALAPVRSLFDDVADLLCQVDDPPPPGSREWDAIVEALAAPGRHNVDVVIALADSAVSRAGLPFDLPRPELVAHCNEFGVDRVRGPLPCGAFYSDGIITVSTSVQGRKSFAFWHEIAEALWERSGIQHTHADVQRTAIALPIASDVVESAIKRYGRTGAERVLTRKHRFASRWQVQLRLWMRDAHKNQSF